MKKKSSSEKYIKKLGLMLGKAMKQDRIALGKKLARLKIQAAKGSDLTGFLKKAGFLENQIKKSAQIKEWKIRNRPSPKYDESLPIIAKKDEIIEAIRTNRVVVISGETGSGKTTQIPKFCIEAKRGMDGKIGCTQPRRIAAITVAKRISLELGDDKGRFAGYKIRFQDTSDPRAFIKVMTDGILLAETQGDRWLNEYDTIIVDEAHERSLNIDFVLGMLKNLVKKRKDLRLIITSATIDTEKFSKAFDNAPVIEVSGRMYPVDVKYLPDEFIRKNDKTHVDLAVEAVLKLVEESPYGGDILVFMPTERDIRETCDLIGAKKLKGIKIMPLFSRLSSKDQTGIFSPLKSRKIIVATNIAETSVTIPGITYVVDTGLARISRYIPGTRTTALPVVPISKSSADQRKGRCGRIKNGVCIRLYTREDYEARPRFTLPEILRANLAEVILRMIFLNLGEIRDFPFIDRPLDKNINDGVNLLFELSAISRKPAKQGNRFSFRLTKKGRIMARMPIDPRLSKILLEASMSGCLKEMVIIASALSIQDPRERPAEKEKAADEAHKKFVHPHSDFITLINIWNAWHKEKKKLKSVGPMKKFCKENFLSFRRMGEWIDIHRQITMILKEHGIENMSQTPSDKKDGGEVFSPLYTAIHKALLSGFLSNIAVKKEKYIFTAAKNREVMIFPGSGIFENCGKWIVAGEMVETSRIFARMAANIKPEWIEPVGKNLCKYTYLNPHWERKKGEVVITEKVSLYGLEIVAGRKVPCSNTDPEKAREIFIKEALVKQDLKQSFPFMEHNSRMIKQAKEMEDKIRRRDILVSDEDLYLFYDKRLGSKIYDIKTLKIFLKNRKNEKLLRMKPDDLILYEPDDSEMSLYPSEISLGNHVFPCDYKFDPGKENDGVTVKIPCTATSLVPKESVDWLVPGLFREKVTFLIKGLPKEYRKRLVPVSNTVEIICREMEKGKGSLKSCLSRFILKKFGIDIPLSAWRTDALPDHLKMRISIQGPKGEEICAARDPKVLEFSEKTKVNHGRFEFLMKKWEKRGIKTWDFGDLNDFITIKGDKGEKWIAWPGLFTENDEIILRLFTDKNKALNSHKKAVAKLFTLFFEPEIKYLKKILKLPKDKKEAAAYFGGIESVGNMLFKSTINDLFCKNIRTEKEFKAIIENKGSMIIPHAQKKLGLALDIMNSYHNLRKTLFALENANTNNIAAIRFLAKLRDELTCLVPENFIILYKNERLKHLPRYIKAIEIRAQRGLNALEKDKTKWEEVKIHIKRLKELSDEIDSLSTHEKQAATKEFFWLIEEFKVSVFAQELKTHVKISSKRLEKRYHEIKMMG